MNSFDKSTPFKKTVSQIHFFINTFSSSKETKNELKEYKIQEGELFPGEFNGFEIDDDAYNELINKLAFKKEDSYTQVLLSVIQEKDPFLYDTIFDLSVPTVQMEYASYEEAQEATSPENRYKDCILSPEKEAELQEFITELDKHHAGRHKGNESLL